MNGVTIKTYKAMKEKVDRLTLRLFVEPTQRNWMKWTAATDALSKAYPSPAADIKSPWTPQPGDVEIVEPL